LTIPHYPELAVKSVWETFKSNQTIQKYMPDYDEKELPERFFLWKVVATLYPTEIDRLVRDVRKRRALSVKSNKDEMVEMSATAKQEIESLMVHSSKFFFAIIFFNLYFSNSRKSCTLAQSESC
jgi:hypothetical protein